MSNVMYIVGSFAVGVTSSLLYHEDELARARDIAVSCLYSIATGVLLQGNSDMFEFESEYHKYIACTTFACAALIPVIVDRIWGPVRHNPPSYDLAEFDALTG